MKANTSRNMLKRLLILGLVVLFLLSTNVIRVFYLQVVRGEELALKAEGQQMRDTEISAMRGTIYDSDGNILAQSATVWNIFLDPLAIVIESDEDATEKDILANEAKTEKRRNLIVEKFTELFEYDEKEKEALIEKTKQENHYVIVEKKVENNLKEEISAFISENDLNCIGMEQATKRYYPYGSLASSVLGFTGADDQGLSGLEAYYDDELTGTNGRIITARDAYSYNIENDYETSVEATDGMSLVTTINQTIQYYLEKGLRETLEDYQAKGAYGVVMNCKTGAVLAMSSMPDFDCNDPYKLTYNKNIKAIKKISNKEEKQTAESEAVQNQWRNFTVSDTYVPGSVFKTFIASAALEENVVSLNTTYNCTGSIMVKGWNQPMKCHYHPGHGVQTFTQGLENSCNPFFITVGQKLGVHNYFKYFDGFGFTQKTGIDLPGEASPQYYTEDQYSLVELSSASMGQTNSISPIQVCTGLSAIANGGKLVTPYLVSSIVDSDGKTVSKTETNVVRQVISAETAAAVRGMMKSVVDNGTGKNGYVAGYSVGGKTGTSTKLGESKEGEGDKYILSFGAIAPTDNPELAMIIIVDEPNEDLGGGALCAPIAAQVIEEAMSVLGIEPKYGEDESKNLSSYTPNVTGNSIEDAKKTIEEYKLNYTVIGKGDKIVRQCPTSAVTIPNGGTIYLYTDDSKKQTVKVPDFTGLTVNEAKRLATDNDLNIEVTGNNLSSGSMVASRQSEEKGTELEKGSVVTVTFKTTESVLD
ncbi:MAG: penicillin-binding transpeptidase domain-containing protein [Clostridium sp.]|nr:penicillin-binding transpeptidase domain-containing protein [Clostridium sp.]